MAIITRITTQKNNKERFNIFMDRGNGEEYGFSVDQDVLIKFQLKKGKHIDESDLKEMLVEDDIRKAFNLALNYLSYRIRSKNEVIQYLKKKQYEDHIIEKVLQKLEQYNYVNDVEFAKAYVRSKKRTSTNGPRILKQELVQKGISQINIEKALEEYSFESQFQVAMKFAEKQVKKAKKQSKTQLQQKIEKSLLNKGFAGDIVHQVISEIETGLNEEDEKDALCYHYEKAKKKYQKYSGFEYERKMKQYLYRRGFSLELIESYLREDHLDH